MTVLTGRSLFDEADVSPIAGMTDWISGLISGQIAVSLCVLAVALLGLRLLTGHLAIARGARTIFGIFILLGAPTIAVTMASWADERPAVVPLVLEPQGNVGVREELPAAGFDPYAGASLR